MTPEIALWAAGILTVAVFFGIAIEVLTAEESYEEEDYETKLMIERHNKHLETMVRLEAQLGRIPTAREIWQYEMEADLVDFSGEIPKEES